MTFQRSSCFGWLFLVWLCGCSPNDGPATRGPAEFNEPRRLVSLTITLTGNRTVRIGEDSVKLSDLRPVLEDYTADVRASGGSIKRLPVRLYADDEATFSDLVVTVDKLWGCGFDSASLNTSGKSFPLLEGGPMVGPFNSSFVPCVVVQVRANPNDSLAAIKVTIGRFESQVASVDEVQELVIEYFGDDTGPGSLRDVTRAAVGGDDHLKLSHIAEVCVALNEYESADGNAVPLIERVLPYRRVELEYESVEELDRSPIRDVEVVEFPDDDFPSIPPPPADLDPPDIELIDRKLISDEPAWSVDVAIDDEHIAAALQWLARQQLDDGGWRFGGPHVGGMMVEARNAATALALLAFLRSGQTHQAGKYQEVVGAGLEFLLERIKLNAEGGSFVEPGGTMYSHALASIALCEAYAATRDKRLLGPAQKTIDFITSAQDPVGGGWRYESRQAGDISVTAWQVQALKAGHMAYLQVGPKPVQGAIKFLDSAAVDDGAFYGYMDNKRQPGPTVIGLLCRSFLGWDQKRESVARGVKWVRGRGIANDDSQVAYPLYYNYFATEFLFREADAGWDDWRTGMTQWLIAQQSKEGDDAGSWFLEGDAGAGSGGRLYCTAFAVLTLRTCGKAFPRRFVPDDDFPL